VINGVTRAGHPTEPRNAACHCSAGFHRVGGSDRRVRMRAM
jgi:hypothetical protein